MPTGLSQKLELDVEANCPLNAIRDQLFSVVTGRAPEVQPCAVQDTQPLQLAQSIFDGQIESSGAT